MSKFLLITGATGKQGGAVIAALANNPAFTLLAVTRNTSSPSATKLAAKGSNIKLVQGDMNDVPALFSSATSAAGKAGIWGVYSVQISQGPGSSFDGEIKQGNDMIDEAVRNDVKHFVYSSVDRGGDEKSWDVQTPIPHFQTKYHIEKHLKSNAEKMGWTVLRPVAFMDNLAPGFPTKVFLAALRDTLNGKSMQWVACSDIGVFARLAFENPEEYKGKAIGLAGANLTSEEVAQAFEKTTGSRLEGTFWPFGWVLKTLVGELGLMINWFGSDGYGADIPALKKRHSGLMGMEEWIRKDSAFAAKA